MRVRAKLAVVMKYQKFPQDRQLFLIKIQLAGQPSADLARLNVTASVDDEDDLRHPVWSISGVNASSDEADLQPFALKRSPTKSVLPGMPLPGEGDNAFPQWTRGIGTNPAFSFRQKEEEYLARFGRVLPKHSEGVVYIFAKREVGCARCAGVELAHLCTRDRTCALRGPAPPSTNSSSYRVVQITWPTTSWFRHCSWLSDSHALQWIATPPTHV